MTPDAKTHESTPLALGTAELIARCFPSFSERTWRRWDSAGRTPRGFKVCGKKVWNVRDLELWAAWGYPKRADFERRQRETAACRAASG